MESTTALGNEPVGRLLIHYSIPAMAGLLTNALYQFVDRIMVGRGVGTDAVAAVTSAYPLSIVAMALALLVGTGTANQISVLLGRRDIDQAEQILGQSLRLALINGAVLVVFTWLFTRPLLIACGCPHQSLSMALPFARITAVGQIFMIILLSMGNIMRLQGWPVAGFFVMLASNLLNAALAALAVFVLRWGVTGTALATAISQALGCISVLLFVQSHRSTLRIRRAYLGSNRAAARTILVLGAPFGVMQLFGTLVFLAANHGAGSQRGTEGVAALGILNTIAMLLVFPPLGVMRAMQPLIGYNKGAGKDDRVRAILVRVLAASLAMGVLFSVAAVAGAQAIAVLFSKSDPTLVELVRDGLPWFTVPTTLFCLSGTVAHYFMSMHQPKKAGVLLLGRQLLAIPLFLLLPRCCGFRGIYWASPCAELPFALIAARWLLEELRTLKRQPETSVACGTSHPSVHQQPDV